MMMVCVGLWSWSWAHDMSFINRAGRWADESLRYESHPHRVAVAEQQAKQAQQETEDTWPSEVWQAVQYLRATYPDLYNLDHRVDMFNGNALRYPQYYTETKRQIILHHTARLFPEGAWESRLYGDEEMKRIYEFHTLNRQFGDIAYHYLIWPDGTIYEWRAWWRWVVGTHTRFNNPFSLWVALMGNFEEQHPTAAQINSAKKLVAYLVQQYAIDPEAPTLNHIKSWLYPFVTPKTNVSIIGHMHAGQTACPGENFLSFLPGIRDYARQVTAGFVGFPVVIDDGDYLENESHHDHHDDDQYDVPYDVNNQDNDQDDDYYDDTVILMEAPRSDISVEEARVLQDKHFFVRMTALESLGTWLLDCDCFVRYDKGTVWPWKISVSYRDGLYTLRHGTTTVQTPFVLVMGDHTVINYTKTSYVWVPRNEYEGMMLFVNDMMFNIVSLQQYLDGVLIANDADPLLYNHLLALAVKNHLIIQRSQTPFFVDYATDSIPPYVGAGLQETLKYRPRYVQDSLLDFVVANDTLVELPFGAEGVSHSVLEREWFMARDIDVLLRRVYGQSLSLHQ